LYEFIIDLEPTAYSMADWMHQMPLVSDYGMLSDEKAGDTGVMKICLLTLLTQQEIIEQFQQAIKFKCPPSQVVDKLFFFEPHITYEQYFKKNRKHYDQ